MALSFIQLSRLKLQFLLFPFKLKVYARKQSWMKRVCLNSRNFICIIYLNLLIWESICEFHKFRGRKKASFKKIYSVLRSQIITWWRQDRKQRLCGSKCKLLLWNSKKARPAVGQLCQIILIFNKFCTKDLDIKHLMDGEYSKFDINNKTSSYPSESKRQKYCIQGSEACVQLIFSCNHNPSLKGTLAFRGQWT